MLVQADALI